MNTQRTSRNLLIIILGFVFLSQAVYTFQNITMFQKWHARQTREQFQELGLIVQEQFAPAIKYDIPLDRLARVDTLLRTIVDDTPELAFIDVAVGAKTIYTAARTRQALSVLEVPILGMDGREVAHIRLGSGPDIRNHTARMLFDLFTILFVGLVVTYELLKFFSTRMLSIPGRETVQAANCLLMSLRSFPIRINSAELSPFVIDINRAVGRLRQRIERLQDHLNELAAWVQQNALRGRNRILELIEKQRHDIAGLARGKAHFTRIVAPAGIRPIVFLFILATNLHASFMPFFARELARTPGFLTARLSEKMIMGLPISAYMIAVTFTMILLGMRWSSRIRPFGAMTCGISFTMAGHVLCGLSTTITGLILARMLCAVGFAVMVIYCRQYIVDHASPEERAFHLAGYASAFSGGLFCSVIIGGIMADYFDYRTIFYAAAGLLALVFLFAHIVFNAPAERRPEGDDQDICLFLKTGIRDRALMAILFQGILTRVLVVGLYYYAIPIFLKASFGYGDIGRIMMFYGVTGIVLASFLNKSVRQPGQSRRVIVLANIAFGSFLLIFLGHTENSLQMALFAIAGLLVMGVASSLTFPSQINVLLATATSRKVGSRTPMAVHQALERFGSALGPIVFGYMASYVSIGQAIAFAGIICLAGNLLFFALIPAMEEDPRETPSGKGVSE